MLAFLLPSSIQFLAFRLQMSVVPFWQVSFFPLSSRSTKPGPQETSTVPKQATDPSSPPHSSLSKMRPPEVLLQAHLMGRQVWLARSQKSVAREQSESLRHP